MHRDGDDDDVTRASREAAGAADANATGVEPAPEPDPDPEDHVEADAGDAVPVDDARAATPEGAVAQELRDGLGSMREESDRIAALDTGQEQVEAAERFAEDAGRLDEAIGSAARAADDERG